MTQNVANTKDIEVEDIKPNTLIKDFDFDSLDFVELQVTVKKNYNLSLNNTFFNDKTTFIEMCNYINNKD